MTLRALWLASALMIGCGGDPDTDTDTDTDTDIEPTIAAGATVYSARCSGCHGANGGGGSGPNLDLRVPALSDAQLAGVIRDGKGSMPPFGSVLSDLDIDSLILFLRDRHR